MARQLFKQEIYKETNDDKQIRKIREVYRSHMKLLMENWRKFLKEEEARSFGGWTVADLQELIELGREGENKQANSLLGKLFGYEAIKLIPYLGQVLTAGEMLKGYYNKLKRSPEGPDTAEDFPALAVLNIDPNLIDTIEDDILNRIDDQYQKYLSDLNPDTKLSDVVSINDFIRNQIAKETNQHVVIRDEAQ